ncbi:hypothetical protein ONZ45_g6988 [Pleurotus djamor]|nr:hypothetical protein ONZ45_g6988 [Pleurotus djamor]
MPGNPPSDKGARESDSGENTSIRKRYVLYVEPVRSGYGHQFMVSPDWQAKSEGYRETPMKISLASPAEVELPKSGTGEVEESGREHRPEHPVPQQSESNGQVPFREHEHSTSEEDHDHHHSATRPAPSSVQMVQSTVLRVASEHPATSQSSKLETTHSGAVSASGTQRQTTPSHTSYTVSAHSSISSASETLLAAETASTQEPSSLSSTEISTSSSVEGSSTMSTVFVPVASTNGTGVAPTPVALSSALHTPPVYISIVVGCIAFIAMLAAVIGWAIRVRSSTRRRWNERISIRRLDSDGSGSGGIRSWWTLPFMHRAGSGRESMATIQNDHVVVAPVHLQVPHPSQSDGVRIDFPSSLGDTGGLNVGGEFGMGSGTELPMRRTLSSKRRHQRADSDTIRSEMVQNHHPRSRQSTLQSYRFPNPFEWQEPPSPPMPEAEVHVEEEKHQPSSEFHNGQPQLPRMDSFGLGVGLGLNLDSMRGLHVMNRSAGDGTSIATDRSAEGSSRAGTSMVVNDSANPTPSTSAAYLNPMPLKDVDVTEATPMNTISSFPKMPSFPSMLNTIKTTFNAAFSPSAVAEEDKYTRAPTRLRDAEILGDDHNENPGEGGLAGPSKQRVRPLSVNKKRYSAAKFEGRENGVRSRSKRLNRRLTGLVSDALKPNPTSRGISRRSRSRMQRLKSSSRESHEPNAGDDVLDYYATEPPNRDTERRPSFLSRTSSSGQSTSSQSSQRSDAPSFMSGISTSSSKDEVMTDREREARDMLLFSRSQAN